MNALRDRLAACKEKGSPSLVVYLTGGFPDRGTFVDLIRAVADAGVDAIEIGLPWSDPVLDGPVIQAASQAALAAGVTPQLVLDLVGEAEVPVPVAAMTYCNPVFRMGVERFAHALTLAGLAGAIIPDLPIEESRPWEDAAARADLAVVLMAPPSAADDRLTEICRRSTGFVYGMAIMGVTGARQQLAETATALGDRLRGLTDKPVLLGIGIGSGEQAAAAAEHADGIIVGSAVVRRVLDGEPAAEVGRFVGELREALR